MVIDRAGCVGVEKNPPQVRPIHAAIGGKVITREIVRALREDAIAKCYSCDIPRKRKPLDEQGEGRKKMRQFGKVDIQQKARIVTLVAE